MRTPRDLYEIVDHVGQMLRERSANHRVGPVLVVALKGFVDAGHVCATGVEHLLRDNNATRFVTFDHDALVDYRSKRPVMAFDSNRWTDYDEPELVIDLVQDQEGSDFLLLHGQEPDLSWNAFTSALLELIDEFSISMVVSCYGIPMGVPHTRPLSVTLHATNEALIGEESGWMGKIQVPGSVQNLLEYRMGLVGRDAVGIAVHVPHYLAQSHYPPAAVLGLSRIEDITGLNFDVAELSNQSEEILVEVTRQIEASPEAQEMVSALERQYDSFVEANQSSSLLAVNTPMPTAEELGAEFEKFLAQQDGPDKNQN